VSGRLDDPRFDFSEAIWQTLRTVAVRAITLPVSLVEQAGLDPDRLVATEPVEGADGEGRVELAVVDPEAPRRSRIRELFRRLGAPPEPSETRAS
jgi:hypothetical protein